MTPEQLRMFRTLRMLSKKKLADKLGRDRVTIWRWECGTVPIPDWLESRLKELYPEK